MLGSRGLWHEGWKAVTTHPTIAGWGKFNDDEWELYHTDIDRSETHNLAAEQPDKLRELVNIWFAEAGANGAFPLDDRSALEIMQTPRPQLTAPRDRYVYYPGTAAVPEWQSVNVKGRSFVIGALVDIPEGGAEGVLLAQGSRFGGHGLYVKNNRLHYVNSFVGKVEQKVVGDEDIPTGENLILSRRSKGRASSRTTRRGRCRSTTATTRSARRRSRSSSEPWSIPGSSLFVGRQEGDVSPTTIRGKRRTASAAARLTGWRSTSAASRTWTWSAKPS